MPANAPRYTLHRFVSGIMVPRMMVMAMKGMVEGGHMNFVCVRVRVVVVVVARAYVRIMGLALGGLVRREGGVPRPRAFRSLRRAAPGSPFVAGLLCSVGRARSALLVTKLLNE